VAIRRTAVDDAVLSLSEKLIQQNCVLFAGDLISSTLTIGNTTYHGLPSRSDMLKNLRQTRSYINDTVSFADALTMKEIVEGRTSVLTFIRDQYTGHPFDALPTHLEIATLPVSAIVTINWDSLVEQALNESAKTYQVIIEDEDIPLYRSDTLPLIKLNGSLDRSKIYGTADDILDVLRARPLLSSFIKVICAQRTLLFVGFDLKDPDFIKLARALRRELGIHVPLSYAVFPNPSTFDIDYWSRQQVHVIPAETFDFLQRLNAQILLNSSKTLGESAFDDSLWMENPFFRPLFQIRSLPTESQVVDGILVNTLKILDGPTDLSEVGRLVVQAIIQIADFRPNYAALAILAKEKVRYWFPPHTQTKEESKALIERELSDRRHGKEIIGEKGHHIIEPNDKLLLYVQSTRVHAVVNTWLQKNANRASSLELIVPEARPKSPTPFQDALATVAAISNAEVQITLIPDMSIGTLMEQGRITKVLFGAHKILQYEDGSYVITNVTGTLLISKLAVLYNIPIFIFAEEEKVYPERIIGSYPKLVATFSMPEEQLISSAHPVLSRLQRTKLVRIYNPGYDDISSKEFSFTLITDKREITVGPKSNSLVSDNNSIVNP
jgi:translation initiation factor 2B subunit (eIF-2B alpha/beta/delta family)